METKVGIGRLGIYFRNWRVLNWFSMHKVLRSSSLEIHLETRFYNHASRFLVRWDSINRSCTSKIIKNLEGNRNLVLGWLEWTLELQDQELGFGAFHPMGF